MRVGIASIMQETNTFSVSPSTLENFVIAVGDELLNTVAGTNSELAGALEVIEKAGAEAVPLMYAWAMPSGRLTRPGFDALREMLVGQLREAGELDAVVLSLHGSMAAEGIHDADGELLSVVRDAVGREIPIALSLDLHANVTRRMVELSDSISAYHTDPHVDMRDTGRRAAVRALDMLSRRGRPSIGYAKRPMIVPAETMSTETGILSEIRARALEDAPDELFELGIFPVQPWLDVPELGLSVVAVTSGGQEEADAFAEMVADRIWARRDQFQIVKMMKPEAALEAAAASSTRPFIIAESADAPTAGASGDSPIMVAASLSAATDLITFIPVVDPAAVAICHDGGPGARVELRVGASIDDRWWDPVALEADVLTVGEGTYRLEGASFTGMEVSMGKFATVAVGATRLLLTEKVAWTSDPATFRFAGLPPERADVIVVRSCSDFRPNYPESSDEAITLDVPGAATPNLGELRFEMMERPPYPLDPWHDIV